jgi:hypothetical protein
MHTFDVRITSTHSPCCTDALEKNHQDKIRSYPRDAQASNVGFTPLIFDISGQMHPSTLLILKTSLKRAATIKHIPFPIYWNYWISALMCIL